MDLNDKVIYQIFVRNYSKEGTFKSVTNDLKRIKNLGVDIIYLMPINEIGIKERKGKYGSPYASKDYFSISSDLGTLEDLKQLINETHRQGMKIIVDMVFNHTSPDNILTKSCMNYYYLKNGKPGNRVGEWSDIIDLKTEDYEVQSYLISVLKYWANVGFDGFRFDVASIINLELFKRARKELGNDIIFLAESVDADFQTYLLSQNQYCSKDEELYPTFDILYNYNCFRDFERFYKTNDESFLIKAISTINKESEQNPLLLRANCLENHDNPRIASYFNGDVLDALTAFAFFLKGSMFIQYGQERNHDHLPELFEKDPVDWHSLNIDKESFFKELANFKHKHLDSLNNQTIERIDYLVYKVTRWNDNNKIVGLFNFGNKENSIKSFEYKIL